MSTHLTQSQNGDWLQPTKFDELRLKTERQLVRLIHVELDLALREARLALKSSDTWVAADESRRRADKGYATVSRLLPLVAEIAEEERKCVEWKLDHLKRMLEAQSGTDAPPLRAEDEIAALAKAVGVFTLSSAPLGPSQRPWQCRSLPQPIGSLVSCRLGQE
jgi:hypothetical protein